MKKLAGMIIKRFFQVMDLEEFKPTSDLPEVGKTITVVHAPDKKGSDAFAGYEGRVTVADWDTGIILDGDGSVLIIPRIGLKDFVWTYARTLKGSKDTISDIYG